MKKKKNKSIKKIMKHFDFKRVHKTMEALEWEWVFVGVPSLEEIKKFAKELLIRSVSEKITISTGGFTSKYDEKDNTISLSFIVTDWTEDISNKKSKKS
jgi:hypothetical protein